MRNIRTLLIRSATIIIIAYAFFWLLKVYQDKSKPILVPLETSSASPMYHGIGNTTSQVSILTENIPGVSHLEITPDGNYLLASTLPGKIFIFHKTESGWQKQNDLFFELDTAQPGWPPEEAGLTGLAFGADFTQGGDIFLTYSFAQKENSFNNRVHRVTFSKNGQKVYGVNPIQIFESNTPGTGSHQIQDGVGVMVMEKPHFMFTIGEGFVSERALDPTKEAGKVMLIQRDGSDPLGNRPFPDSPKVQALGIRNAPATAISPKNGKITIADTGPNNYDRFILGVFYDQEGKNAQPLSLNWDGSEDSLMKNATDLYIQNKSNMILHRWAPTETAVNVVFYTNDMLPKIDEKSEYVLVTLFGITGEPNNKPGKQIVLGKITYDDQPKVVFEPFIERTKEAEGKLGHPIGLAVDPVTKTVYFGDIIEGRIYQVEIE